MLSLTEPKTVDTFLGDLCVDGFNFAGRVQFNMVVLLLLTLLPLPLPFPVRFDFDGDSLSVFGA